jgi:hypothetical protein
MSDSSFSNSSEITSQMPSKPTKESLSLSSSSSKSDSTIKLDTLEKEFDIVMKMYEEAYKTYVSSLSDNIAVKDDTNNTTSSSPTKYITLKGRTYWGTSGLKEGSVNSIEECQTMCSEFGNCEGATYNSSKNYCWARSGEGTAEASEDPDDNALVPELKQNAIILKMLNDKLIDLNTKILDELKNVEKESSESIAIPSSSSPSFSSNNNNSSGSKSTNLKDQLDSLTKDKSHIDQLMQQIENIDAEFKDSHTKVIQSNVSYIFYFIIALIILSISIGNSTFSKFAILLIIISIIIAVSTSHS